MRRVLILSMVSLCAVAFAAGSALGSETFTINFSGGAQGFVDGVWGSAGNLWANDGGESSSVRLGITGGAGCVTALFNVGSLPSDFAGATVQSATLGLQEAYWTGVDWVGVKMLEVKPSAPVWAAGDGTWSTRWSASNGATQTFANHNAAGGGVDWTGATCGNNSASTGDITQIFGTLCDTEEVLGSHATTNFNVQTAAQDWANGSNNRGLVMSLATATDNGGSPSVDGFRGLSMTITYTPAPTPEPATMAVLALGGLAMLRRRR
jgi:MYXO-CTERM domain-containing protein